MILQGRQYLNFT